MVRVRPSVILSLMSHVNVPDPVGLIGGTTLAPEPYRCSQCRAIEIYPGTLPTGGAACVRCGAKIAPADVVSFAPASSRLLSALCDLVLLAPPLVTLLLLVAWIASGYAPKDHRGDLTEAAVRWITTSLIVIAVAVLGGYLWISNGLGRTIGKRVVALKVLRLDNGEPLGVVRGLVRTLAQVATICTLGLGFAIVLFDRRRRALHDRIAGTVVVDL